VEILVAGSANSIVGTEYIVRIPAYYASSSFTTVTTTRTFSPRAKPTKGETWNYNS